MTENIKLFLAKSPMAEKIKLPARVIVHRTRISPGDILGIKARGHYGPVYEDEEVCELEIGGQVIASGKIVKKGRHYFFKVCVLLEEEESGEN
jgi:hypothetical protein